MTEAEFKALVIGYLKELHESVDHKTDDLKDRLSKIAVDNAVQTKDIETIKIDLREHKEGVIQNRARIEILEKSENSRSEQIEQSFTQYKENMKPIVDYVLHKKEYPQRVKATLISLSKVLGSIAVIVTTIGTAIGYLVGFIKF